MDRYRLWCRITVVHQDAAGGDSHAGGGSQAAGDLTLNLGGPGPPTIGAVDTLARIALLARRAKATVRLSHVAPEMHELLELSGLDLDAGLGHDLHVEMRGQPERGEDQLAVEETVESRDPPV